MKYGHVAAYYWGKAYGESIETIRSTSWVEAREMDEMYAYIYWVEKTPASYGSLSNEMKNHFPIAYWESATLKWENNYAR